MKISLNLRDDLIRAASKCTGIAEKTALIHKGLEELIKFAARKRLSELGGTLNTAQAPKRKQNW